MMKISLPGFEEPQELIEYSLCKINIFKFGLINSINLIYP